jgi:hypothetical protein
MEDTADQIKDKIKETLKIVDEMKKKSKSIGELEESAEMAKRL